MPPGSNLAYSSTYMYCRVQEFGMLGDTGLPRLLDMGQCNDAFSALVVASELAKVRGQA